MFKKSYLLSVAALFFVVSCDTASDIPPVDTNRYLVSDQFNRTITQQQLAAFWTLAGQSEASTYALYDIDIYRIVYNTTGLDGRPLEASGAIMVPKGIENPGLLSVQHATIFNNDEAPSVDRPGIISVVTRKALFASMGYITFLPDYLGYGVSAGLMHPYQHKETLATASYDMIMAGLEFIEEKNIQPSDFSVNMLGYSEGAYATLALAELTETSESIFETGFISMGGGIYDLSSTMEYLLLNINEPNECVACYAYFIYVYHTIYDLPGTLSLYLNEPYDETVSSGLFDGGFSDSQIRASLPRNTKDLIRESFISGYLEGEFLELRNALQENNIDYIPEATLLLAHGTADSVAPVFNSDHFYENALMAGKTNITYIRTEGANHSTGIFDWAIETLEALDRRGNLAVIR
jgi:pimeloyl-ACP methyl ester carboxylesterase